MPGGLDTGPVSIFTNIRNKRYLVIAGLFSGAIAFPVPGCLSGKSCPGTDVTGLEADQLTDRPTD